MKFVMPLAVALVMTGTLANAGGLFGDLFHLIEPPLVNVPFPPFDFPPVDIPFPPVDFPPVEIPFPPVDFPTILIPGIEF